jgi:hypothetical protein
MICCILNVVLHRQRLGNEDSWRTLMDGKEQDMKDDESERCTRNCLPDTALSPKASLITSVIFVRVTRFHPSSTFRLRTWRGPDPAPDLSLHTSDFEPNQHLVSCLHSRSPPIKSAPTSHKHGQLCSSGCAVSAESPSAGVVSFSVLLLVMRLQTDPCYTLTRLAPSI